MRWIVFSVLLGLFASSAQQQAASHASATDGQPLLVAALVLQYVWMASFVPFVISIFDVARDAVYWLKVRVRARRLARQVNGEAVA